MLKEIISLKVGGNVLTVDASGIHFNTANYEKIRVVGVESNLVTQNDIGDELVYTAKVQKYENDQWIQTTDLQDSQLLQLNWRFIKNNDQDDTELLQDNPSDDDIEIDGLTMKVTLQDDNTQKYGHAHCFVSTQEEESHIYTELRRQLNVKEVLGKNLLDPIDSKANYTVVLNIDNPTQEEIKDLKVEIQEKDSTGKVTIKEAKVKEDLTIEHTLKEKKDKEAPLVEIRVKVYPQEYPENSAETISHVRPMIEGEITNVSINTKERTYTPTAKTDEELIVSAKTNASEGEALPIKLEIFMKGSEKTKIVELEEYVENTEINRTLTLEEIAQLGSVDVNDIKETQATIIYKDKEYKSNKTKAKRTLVAKVWADNGTLNDIVEDKKKVSYKKGRNGKPNSKGEEVKLIQTAFQKMNINIGNDGVDGVFGNDTDNAVKTFQENYTATHNTHQYTWGEPDGVVGKNTMLAMDEALVGGWKYIEPEKSS